MNSIGSGGGRLVLFLCERLPKKLLVFMDAAGNLYPQDPPPAQSSSGAGSTVTLIGSQIGVWADL